MQFILIALAGLFLILGFTGFAFGGFPTIIFWALAAVCFFAGWKLRSRRQRVREDRNQPWAR